MNLIISSGKFELCLLQMRETKHFWQKQIYRPERDPQNMAEHIEHLKSITILWHILLLHFEHLLTSMESWYVFKQSSQRPQICDIQYFKFEYKTTFLQSWHVSIRVELDIWLGSGLIFFMILFMIKEVVNPENNQFEVWLLR